MEYVYSPQPRTSTPSSGSRSIGSKPSFVTQAWTAIIRCATVAISMRKKGLADWPRKNAWKRRFFSGSWEVL